MAMPIISGTCALYTASKSMPMRSSADDGFSATTVTECPFQGVFGTRDTIPSDTLLCMRKMFAVFKREYLSSVRKKMFIFMTLFFPVLMAALFLIPMMVMSRILGG